MAAIPSGNSIYRQIFSGGSERPIAGAAAEPKEAAKITAAKSAENIKIQVGSAWPLEQELETVMRGRDLITGLPKEMKVSSQEIREALSGSLRTLVNAIKGTIEETPPELVADIMSSGIVLAGGGSMLRNIDKLISEETRMPVHITEDPITAVARGTGIILEDIDLLSKIGSSNIAE